MTTTTQNKEITGACVIRASIITSTVSFCSEWLHPLFPSQAKTLSISVLLAIITFQCPFARIIIRRVRVLPKHGEERLYSFEYNVIQKGSLKGRHSLRHEHRAWNEDNQLCQLDSFGIRLMTTRLQNLTLSLQIINLSLGWYSSFAQLRGRPHYFFSTFYILTAC